MSNQNKAGMMRREMKDIKNTQMDLLEKKNITT